ncbi:MAG: aminopeptidase [Armatimonadetes bacterium]|nr:aminopeptidase [Armatimonadota bacterium]
MQTMFFRLTVSSLFFCLAATVNIAAHAQAPRPNPFAAPAAKKQLAPERDYDLQNVRVLSRVDAANKLIYGRTQNTLAPLRAGLTELRFHKGESIAVSAVTVNKKTATFSIDGEFVKVATAPLPANVPVVVEIEHVAGKKQGGGFGDGGGIHWLTPTPGSPNRTGFWTQGESDYNREWAITWDYPNDFATTETVTTVPTAWNVVGNGLLVSDTPDAGGETHTVTWRIKNPHATYLMSLVAAPMDTQTGVWEGVPLLYTVPRGKKALITDSFSDTPDMLAFFSKITGVKYPWQKYAQNAVYEFGGGMENISSTTLGEGSLTDARSGYRDMASLNSHELAHQWFGDYVTCETWGDAWLNESFATFFQVLYFEHSRGKNAYDNETSRNIASYLRESRRYKRPVSTDFYSDPDDLFDSHAYPKGGVILHTLRRELGDEAFFKGIKQYLTANANQPVTSQDLAKAMSEGSGTNVQPFFDQWVYKPGHPVIEWSQVYDEVAKETVVTVKQTQDTKDGTPVYTVKTKIGVVVDGKLTKVPVTLNAVENTFRVSASAKPEAVIFDADRDFLREIGKEPERTASENLVLVRLAPCAPDRENALARLLKETPDDNAISTVVGVLRGDTERFPAFNNLRGLRDLKREPLRAFWREELKHQSFDRRAGAIDALGKLSATPEDTATLRAMVTDTAPYAVVASSLRALSIWDAKGNADVLARAAQMPSLDETVRSVAMPLLASADPEAARKLAYGFIKPENPVELRAIGIGTVGRVAKKGDPDARAILLSALLNEDVMLAAAGAQSIAATGDKSLLPDLRDAQTKAPATKYGFFITLIKGCIAQLEKAK